MLLYAWIMQVRNSHKHSGVGLSLVHDVWHLSLEVSRLTVTQWRRLESPGDIFTHIFNSWYWLSSVTSYWAVIKASTNGLSLWSGLSPSGLRVAGLLISCPSLEVKTVSPFMTQTQKTHIIVSLLPYWLKLPQAHLDPRGGNQTPSLNSILARLHYGWEILLWSFLKNVICHSLPLATKKSHPLS